MKKACLYLTVFWLVVGWSSLASVCSSAFQISTTPGEDNLASVASDGTNYLVVWQNSQSGVYRVYGARVTQTGTVLDPSGILIADPGALGRVPCVAFDGTNYFVVWSTNKRWGATIYGARVSVNGAVLDPGGIQITPPESLGQYNPSVAFNGTNYLVVWDQVNCPDGGIFGARVAPNGTVLDSPKISISRPDSTWSCLQQPSVASNQTDFLLAWVAFQNTRVMHARGSRISAMGGVLDPKGINISTAPGSQIEMAVGFDGTNYMVVWNDGRNGNDDIYGARVTSSGSVLDPDGIAIVTDPTVQYSPSLAFDGKNYMVVWADLRNRLNQVWGAEVSPAGNVVPPNGFPIFAGAMDAVTRHVAFSRTNGLVVWENCYNAFCTDSDTYGLLINLSP